MEFDVLDRKMRQYEKGDDRFIAPDVYVIARLDGRGFTRLTKEVCPFEAPFDERFRDMMILTVRHLMADCGFKVLYGFTESDEISLLLHPEDRAFAHKARKLLSVLAGEASAAFSAQLGMPAAFDCRLCEFPTAQLVADYFRWRQEDANRNALNSHCYWMLRKQGKGKGQATALVSGKSIAQKSELLLQNGIDFAKQPAWQKHGVGLRWQQTEREGFNPITGASETATRNTLVTDYDLPTGEAYSAYIAALLSSRPAVRHIITIRPDYGGVVMEQSGDCPPTCIERDDMLELFAEDGERLICRMRVPGLYAWQQEFEWKSDGARGTMGSMDVAAWHKEGLRLAACIRRLLPDDCELWYAYPFEDKENGDKPPILIH